MPLRVSLEIRRPVARVSGAAVHDDQKTMAAWSQVLFTSSGSDFTQEFIFSGGLLRTWPIWPKRGRQSP
ncbi:hypothetical protein JCGZ_19748 [Jatropha curcas]|uniref:Uncharacterized protein n=1 Tax=Jatropha curcas TaxID=180498 RepID=A0A067L813_JATCU|nr:hypothetical protein JCGZ_19748 [Jatropha curcas]